MTTIFDSAAIDWSARLDDLTLDGRLLTRGTRGEAARGETLDLFSPRDGRLITRVAACDRMDVDQAARLARRAFDRGQWSNAQPADRRTTLLRWADFIERDRENLALLICLETGKPIRDCLEIDLRSVVKAVRWYAEAIGKHAGAHPDTGPDSMAIVAREPAGVIGVVTPWNFPLAAIGYEVAPALSLGNSVLVKPSEKAPLSVLRCCELALDAGVPGDVLAVLPGLGAVSGTALGQHPDIDIISVTGSPATGRAFMRYSADSNGKRVWPETGGKSSVIVCPDTADIDQAVRRIVWGAYFNQGQMCTGAARLFVHTRIADEFVSCWLRAAEELSVGDPLSWTTDVGPIISEPAYESVCQSISESTAMGGKLAVGGERIEVLRGGYYLSPALLVNLPPEARLLNVEVFGPIAAMSTFEEIGDAVTTAARSGFGMAASIWTGSLDTALRSAKRMKVGTVWINGFESDDLSVPSGGVRRSGYGRSKSLAALDKYSDLKTTWVELQ
ncbi:aldehyde dehydrogenase family protein [Nocardia sp. NPDC020380]|uniref:aldehyde dehydrogenase family protein n=1 Tax=Nocardia sp. NPDC020380 TaxID=3364309 RepID=UPI0037B718BC